MAKPKTTTRSYTLGLLAPSDSPTWLPLWERLFRTHYAVCRGAKVFSDFYLNLRGGLPASVAETGSNAETDENRRLMLRGTRRILALGWLSVEDDHAAKEHPFRVPNVAAGESLSKERAEELLHEILAIKGIQFEREQCAWVADCIPSLTAAIRRDAVWVNRAAAFAAWQEEFGEDGAAMPEQAARILFSMCGDKFAALRLPDETTSRSDMDSDSDEAATESDEGARSDGADDVRT